ncbi:hypothetical protein [Arthrobacter sp. KBS0702]|uniref:hypothetical protein n=1 Tax=Arthrobacter sp. KBS0702 TaxID=2578107 RepID=UPI0028F42951|nr:hypothetical protein [Arthrobacter sp. KBS0702]
MGSATAAGAADRFAADANTSPAGGQGSPPGTRGRPRRSRAATRVTGADAAPPPSFTTATGTDCAAAGTVS